MAATTTPSISSLLHKLQRLYPDIIFKKGSPSRWSPRTTTVFYETADSAANTAILLHEVSHALLGHADFSRDIELLGKEREAWHHAATMLAPQLDVSIAPQLVEDHLDTYRDWLHQRSICPACQQTGVQVRQKTYSCINCRSSWRVNDARQSALRRFQY